MSRRLKKSKNVHHRKKKLLGGISVAFIAVCLVSSICFSAGASSSDDYTDEYEIRAVSPTDSVNTTNETASLSDADVISPSDIGDFALSLEEADVGKNLTLELTSNRENVTWKSSDETIATVDQSGTVKGVKVGACVVSAEDEEGNIAQCKINVKKVCYLTFDDGPNALTPTIVDTLVKHGAKATFFAGYKKDYLHYVKYIQDNGSLVGMHTYTHNYKVCYKNMYSYYEGLDILGKAIKKYTGTTPNIIRYPGGTNNLVSNFLTMKRITVGANDLGYRIYDWSASSGDASSGACKSKTIKEVKKTCTKDFEIVLFHEKSFNIPALETLLPYLTDKGYIFETLDNCPIEYKFKTRYKDTIASTVVTINKESVSVYEDKTVQLSASMRPKKSTDYIRWSSSDDSVAQVSMSGNVTGIKKGTAVITALTSSGKTDTCIITVKVPTKKVILNKNICYLKSGEQFTLTAELSPAETEDTVKWATSNSRIATVDQNGNVKALRKGYAKITATASNGVSSVCSIHVVNPTSVLQIKNPVSNMYVGQSKTLTAKLSLGAYDPVTWTSDAPSIVSISASGKIQALSQGYATITATSYSGMSDSVKIYVRSKATQIKLSSTSKKVLIDEPFTLEFDIIQPKNCNDTVKWKVSNSRALSLVVSDDGRSAEIVGKYKGTYTVTVSTGSKKSASCRVTVVKPTESLKINKTETSLYIGKKITLSASPVTKGSNDYVESWSSSDESVAKVSKGKVTAISKGTAIITATSFSGKTVTCKVVVRQKAKSVSLSQTSMTAKVGDVIVLNGSITSPENCNDTVSWNTSSARRAVILNSDQNSAEIKMVGKGTVYITFKAGSGKSVRCRIVCK